MNTKGSDQTAAPFEVVEWRAAYFFTFSQRLVLADFRTASHTY